MQKIEMKKNKEMLLIRGRRPKQCSQRTVHRGCIHSLSHAKQDKGKSHSRRENATKIVND